MPERPIPLHIEPDPDDPACATVLVDVTLCGEPARFVLDTGAARSTIARSAVSDGLEPLGIHRSGGVFGTLSEPIVRVPDLRVGDVHVRDLEVTVTSASDSRIRNMLGLDVLARHAWRISFSDRTFVRDPPEPATPWLPLSVGQLFHPYVEIAFDGAIRARAVLDTGAGVTLLDAGFARRHPQLVTADGSASGWDSTGATQQTDMAALAACCIGGVRFGASRAAIVDLSALESADGPFDAIAGYPLLVQADWWLDIPRRRWALVDDGSSRR